MNTGDLQIWFFFLVILTPASPTLQEMSQDIFKVPSILIIFFQCFPKYSKNRRALKSLWRHQILSNQWQRVMGQLWAGPTNVSYEEVECWRETYAFYARWVHQAMLHVWVVLNQLALWINIFKVLIEKEANIRALALQVFRRVKSRTFSEKKN